MTLPTPHGGGETSSAPEIEVGNDCLWVDRTHDPFVVGVAVEQDPHSPRRVVVDGDEHLAARATDNRSA